MRIAIVQGTRPEIIKNYPVVSALFAARVPFLVMHTNQHSLPSMCDRVYRDMNYQPDMTLPGDYRFGAAIDWLQQRFRRDGVDHVIVNGDTAASLAGSLAAMYLGIDVSHIEAGLRAGDVHMLEERNRIMVDCIASLLFAYTTYEQDQLQRTSEIRGNVYSEGNTTVDVLHDFASRTAHIPVSGKYVFVTMHRKEFTDSPLRMRTVFEFLRETAESSAEVIFSLHPRTEDAMRRHGLRKTLLGNVKVIEPVSVFDSLALQKHATAVITDSGCIQEEAYLLGVPCVTLRENTERHLTVAHGANVVTGFAPAAMRSGIQWALATKKTTWPDIYGAAGAGSRIVRRVLERQPTSERAVDVAFA
jgi:UDP-N-acetylglucosamine 2-epimerase